MLKKIMLMALLSFAVYGSLGAEWRGRANVLFGNKSLDSNDWGELDSQSEFGVEFDLKNEPWPLWITTGYLRSRDTVSILTSASPISYQDVEGKTTELHLGLKKDIHMFERVRFSLSGGPAWIGAKLGQTHAPFQSEDDAAFGVWGTVDVLVFISQIGLGFSYRYSKANVDLLGQTRDAGGHHAVASIGLAWQ